MEEHTYGGPSAGINSGSGSNLEPVVSHSGRQSLFPLARRAKFRAARRRRRGLSPTRSLRTIELSSLSTPRTLHAGSDTVQRRARELSARQQSRRRASRPEDSRGSGMSSRRAAASRDDPVRTAPRDGANSECCGRARTLPFRATSNSRSRAPGDRVAGCERPGRASGDAFSRACAAARRAGLSCGREGVEGDGWGRTGRRCSGGCGRAAK